MTLAAGTQLGPYRILSPVGEGGMGEVFRARDSKLGRDVAIKVLRDELARDPDRLDRFEREARLLAQLSHPNVATLHGFEEHDGQKFLVMELVEGKTLTERIAEGPIPIDDAVRIFIEIAEGLGAAHAKGILHRDMKPDNIRFDGGGKPKILDFGLAKAFGEEPAEETSQSPTQAKLTELGAVMGTSSYMSPEQTRGTAVDKRTDIWAFGCCLVEALTGEKAFGGSTRADIAAAVLGTEPNLERLHPRVRDVARTCVAKELRDRYHDIADVRIALEASIREARPHDQPLETSRRHGGLVVGLILGAAIAGLAAGLLGRSSGRLETSVTKFSLPLVQFGYTSNIAISPDGRTLIYQGRLEGEGPNQLISRRLDEFEARARAGTEGATSPVFSPDGEWIAYYVGSELRKIPVGGGAPVTLGEGNFRGGLAWGGDDHLYFDERGFGIQRIASSGGAMELVTTLEPGEITHRRPFVGTDGQNVFFVVERENEERPIVVQSLRTGARRVLVESGTRPRLLASGHLLYLQERSLYAIRIDPSSLEATGPPVYVDDVQGEFFDVSQSGTLVYVPEVTFRESRWLVWVDREGNRTRLGEARAYADAGPPRLSPDGARVALGINASKGPEVWTFDVRLGNYSRVTFSGAGRAIGPVWAPEGETIYFASDRDTGSYHPFAKAADATGDASVLLDDVYSVPSHVSADGRFLLLRRQAGSDRDVAMLDLVEGGGLKPLLSSSFDEYSATLSPSGRWLAYVSNESGREEVYVQSFPALDSKRTVSANGGHEPVWSRDGTELFYREGDALFAVRVEDGPEFRHERAELLFEGRFVEAESGRSAAYDVAPDASKFLMVESNRDVLDLEIRVILNWLEELDELLSAGS